MPESIVDATAAALMRQLHRLDSLALEDADRVKAECDRATAVNGTCRNIIELGDLYVRSQMLQMNAPEREFERGLIFGGQQKAALSESGGKVFGGRTKVNEHGEFVSDDGADAMLASVEDPSRPRAKTPDEKRAYDRERQREYRARKKDGGEPE